MFKVETEITEQDWQDEEVANRFDVFMKTSKIEIEKHPRQSIADITKSITRTGMLTDLLSHTKSISNILSGVFYANAAIQMLSSAFNSPSIEKDLVTGSICLFIGYKAGDLFEKKRAQFDSLVTAFQQKFHPPTVE